MLLIQKLLLGPGAGLPKGPGGLDALAGLQVIAGQAAPVRTGEPREPFCAAGSLKEPLRSTLLLRFYRGLEPGEIARLTGTPAGTVRWRLKRGLELLRERLRARAGSRSSWCTLLLPLVRPETAVVGGLSAPALALGGTLIMNTALKLGAALAVVVVLVLGLTFTGVLQGSLTPWIEAEAPLEVSFRSIETGEGVPHGPVQVQAPEQGRVEVTAPIDGEVAPTAEVTGPTAIEATLVDEGGNALSGSFLRVVARGGPEQAAISAANGFVRLELDVPEGRGGVLLEAGGRGLASHVETVRLEPGETVQLGRIALSPGGVILGRVVDQLGRGLPGAIVTSSETNLRRQELEVRRFLATEPDRTGEVAAPVAVSDSSGRFELVGLQEGYVRLWARVDGHLPAYTSPVEVRSGQESYGVEVVLAPIERTNRIRGVVLDPSGFAVPFARLEYVHRSAQLGLTHGDAKSTDADGAFEFVLASDATLSVTARDPQALFGPAAAEGVQPGEDELILRLSVGRRVELVALGSDGARLERFSFTVLSAQDPGQRLQAGEARVDEEENAGFRLPGADYLVRVSAPLHQFETLGPLSPQTTGESLQVQLTPVPGMPGVVLANDAPLAGARVSLHAIVPENERLERNGFPCWMDPSALDEVVSDTEGEFVLSVREPGSYVVRAERDGLAPADLGPLALHPSRSGERIELRIGHGGALEGRVIPPPGDDPTGTLVALHRGDGWARRQRVGPDGAYRFEGLTPGPWRLETCSEDLLHEYTKHGPSVLSFEQEVQWNCDVYEGETTCFDLRLADPDAFLLRGQLGLRGLPPETLRAWLCPGDVPFVEAFDNLDRWAAATIDPEGRFELGAAEPGEWQLVIKHASADDEWVLVDRVHLVSERTAWELEMETGTVAIVGLAPPDPGQEIPPLVYRWEGRGELLYLRLIVPDEDGVCLLEGVPVGRGELVRPSLEPPFDLRRWPVALSLDVARGEETRVAAP